MAWKDNKNDKRGGAGRGRSNDKRKPFGNKEGGKRFSRPGEGKSERGEKRTWEAGKDDFKKADKPFEREEGKSFTRKPYDRTNPSRGYKGKVKLTPQGAPKADDGMVRLNKYIANAGICSRREADTLIESGAITVNGKVVTELGTRIRKTDKVQCEGQTLKNEKLVYLLLNKPKDYITTVNDPLKRRTVLDLVKNACKERIYPVGRLDRNTTGALLLTNDGDLAKKLMHPKHLVKKIYQVSLDKNVKQEDLDKIAEGITLEDGFIKADEVAYSSKENKREVGIEIHSGRNRIVRRIFESLGYKVLKLDRVYFAGLTKKSLSRGQYRFLEEDEVRYLKMLG